MNQLLIKLANLLDNRGYYEQANYIDLLIKLAYDLYFYHGTSTRFLHSILKEGLNADPKTKVWSEEYKRVPGELGLESYPGAYVSNNFMAAYSASTNAVEKFGGNRLFVVGKVETRSPEVRIDEDHVKEPGAGIAIEDKIVSDWYRSSQLLDYFAFDASDEQLQSASKTWVESALKIKPTEAVLKRAVIALKKWLDMRVALEYEKEKAGGGSIWSRISSRLKKRFNGNIPLKYSDAKEAVRNYRMAMDDFLAKAKDLLDGQKDKFITNVRLTKSITYKGANKIEAIIEVDRGDDWGIPAKIKVHFALDRMAVERFLNEYINSIGQYILIN